MARTKVTLTIETPDTDPLDYARALLEAADDACGFLTRAGDRVTMVGGDLDTEKGSSYSVRVETL